MTETDADFLSRYWEELNWDTEDADFDRLFALARRGAAVQEGSEQARLLRDKIGFPLPPPPAGET